jgi:hypothetical protein
MGSDSMSKRDSIPTFSDNITPRVTQRDNKFCVILYLFGVGVWVPLGPRRNAVLASGVFEFGFGFLSLPTSFIQMCVFG